MGTLFRIVTYSSDIPTAHKHIDEAFNLAQQLETVATDYQSNSELNLLCRAPHGKPVPLTPLLFDLLSRAQEIARLTDGAYDPTLGPLTHLWRHTRRTGQLPPADTLAEAKARCGYRHLQLNAENQSATLALPNMQLDLGGIAKGYAADLIFDQLSAHGLTQTLVTAGGDLRLGDPPPEKDAWTVALRAHSLTPGETIALNNCAVSTSGDLHQKITLGNTSYSHLIDPSTGLGLTHSPVATVIAPFARLSDPLATAACLQADPISFFENRPKEHLRLIPRFGAQPVMTERFQKLMEE